MCMCLAENIAVHTAVLNHSRERTFHLCTATAQLPCDHWGVTRCSEQTDVCTTNLPPEQAAPGGTEHTQEQIGAQEEQIDEYVDRANQLALQAFISFDINH